jgi:serralysin
LLAENDDINPGTVRDSRLVFTAPSTGNYYIDIGAFNESYTGTYQLHVDLYTPPPVVTMDVIADQLVNGYWGGDNHHFNVTQGGSLTVNLTALTGPGQNLARNALALWSDIIGVTFVEVSSGGQITFDDNQSGAFSDGIWSNGITTSAHVNVSTQWLATYGTSLNSYSFQSYVHEIGHALGLGHAGNYNGSATFPDDASFLNDSWPSSIMSYFDQSESTYYADLGFSVQWVVTPMLADIRAMATLYGLSTTTRTGDTVYGFNNTSGRTVLGTTLSTIVGYTVFDSGGTDTLDYSGYSFTQTIDLNPESFSNVGGRIGNVTIAFNTIIENAIGGSGDDLLNGNSVSNVLTGGAGNDTLKGNDGDDTLIGGAGNDNLQGGNGIDTVSYATAVSGGVLVNLATGAGTFSGSDAAQVGSDTLTGIENIVGGNFDDTLTGDGNANQIDGGSGNDTIFGGGGVDVLIGGLGNDTVDGGSEADTIYFQHGGNDSGIGGSGNDGFYFGAALNSLDVVDGGVGNDDQVGLQGNYAALTIAAANFAGIETFALIAGNITTFGDPGTNFYDYNITTSGSFGRNIIVTGNGLRAGEDFTFNGSAEVTGSFTFYSGLGVETLTGGAGNDGFYFGTSRFGAGDQVNGGGGGDNQLGLRGDYTIDFNAPAFANALVGIQTIALLSDLDPNFAQAGDGEFDYSLILSDTLVGAGQQLTVTGAGLGATESMVVNGSSETSGSLRLIGGAAADTLTGGGGADTIFGGLSADALRGNAAADTFLYSNVNQSAPGGYDTIMDFTHNVDKLDLSSIDANSFSAGDQAFSFLGSAAFSGTGAASAGQLRAFQANAATNLWQVEGDINGDGIADFVLQLFVASGQSITVADFFP